MRLFSLCDSLTNIFPCDFPTDLPISLLILGYGAGCDISIDMALLNPSTASIESRRAFSSAISIALTQLLLVLEETEVKRISLFLNDLASSNVIECPLRKASNGYDAYLSLLSYSLYLLYNREGNLLSYII